MFIKSVHLKNYLSHEDTYVEFTDDLACLKGDNGHGKSNFVDAIQVAVFNEALTPDDIRHGENSCSITIVRFDGRRLRRSRKGATQEILLLDAEGEEQYKSTSVKDAGPYVEEFFGFKEVTLDKNDAPYNLNFIPLGSPPFLVGKSPEKIMRSLSAVLTGRGVETSKVNMGKQLGVLASELKVDNKMVAQVQERLTYLNDPKWQTYKEKFQSLQSKQDEIEETDSTIAFLSQVKEQQEAIPFTKEEREQIVVASQMVEELVVRGQEFQEIEDRLQGLLSIQAQQLQEQAASKQATEAIDKINEEVKGLEDELKAYVCKTCKKIVTVHA